MKVRRESSFFKRRSVRFIALGVACAVIAIATFAAARRVNQASAMHDTGRAATSRAQTAASLLSSELQKYRLLPLVLSDYPNVQNVLKRETPKTVAKLNARLELIAQRTYASAIYVVRADGRTIAASNWRLPTSFVGHDYGFRPYFKRALRHGSAEQFALGTVSRKPGYFLARRSANGLGVIVVKVEFNRIESIWARQQAPTIVLDANGVAIMASKPAWRLRATHPLPATTREAILRAKIYGDHAPRPLTPDITIPSPPGNVATDKDKQRYIMATESIPVNGWTLMTLEPLEANLVAASSRTLIAALIATLVAVVGFGFLVRSREARAMRLANKLELEKQVELRTAELRGANKKLVHESRERERNEARLRTAREELAQSNRLATLGQITAGVAHEINQPLAALRTFAENANVMIEKGRSQDVTPNVDHIIRLSQRIGDITGELRAFARREPGKGPIMLNTATDGALLLIGDRLRQLGVSVERSGVAETIAVAADRVRVEQILINLLQNASDAISDTPNPTITIATTIHHNKAEVEIGDNGPGINPKLQRELFKSFVTQKADGLGLGLVISRDLAREIGGELTYEPRRRDIGATFLLRLPLA